MKIIKFISSLFAAASLFTLPISSSQAMAGCCSTHGGVSGCAATGFEQCKDGSVSPSCKCDGSTKSAYKAEKKADKAKAKEDKVADKAKAKEDKVADKAKAKADKAADKAKAKADKAAKKSSAPSSEY